MKKSSGCLLKNKVADENVHNKYDNTKTSGLV
jgi:hypothetical protein